MIDKPTQDLIQELDNIATNCDDEVFGLPTHGDWDKKLAAAIRAYRDAAIAEATRWIPVSERMPTNDNEVLTLTGDRECWLASWRADANEWLYLVDGSALETVTHWQPLPPLPAKTKD